MTQLLFWMHMPDAVQLVTSTVRSGLPVNEAFRTIAREMPQPTAGQFAIVCNELSLGNSPEEAVEAIYRRTQVPEYAMFTVTLAVQLKAGGSLALPAGFLGDGARSGDVVRVLERVMCDELPCSPRAAGKGHPNSAR